MRTRALITAVFILCLAVTASAQTTNHNHDFDPLHQFNVAVRKLVSQVTPSVVQVLATGYGPVESSSGNSSALVGMQEKIGSGVIIDPDGYIVTNAHVISGAQHVRVSVPIVAANESTNEPVISRSRVVDARVVGSDEDIDVAVLKIEATGLKALPLGDYNKLRQGDFVFAFGSPEGLQDSVSMGVVSIPARQLDPDSPVVYVQSDAATNPGNSGGPLVNVDGELIGINTFIFSQSGGNEGLGFAIPSAIVAYAYPQLRKYGHLHRGETGIGVQAITPELAAGLKLNTDSGVIVSDVVPGSPAENAGVKVQDIVKTIDGYPIDNLPAVGTRLFMRSGRRSDQTWSVAWSNEAEFCRAGSGVAERLRQSGGGGPIESKSCESVGCGGDRSQSGGCQKVSDIADRLGRPRRRACDRFERRRSPRSRRCHSYD